MFKGSYHTSAISGLQVAVSGQTDKYSKFDEHGIPTHDAGGEKLTKSAYKKLHKEWEKQRRL